MLLIKTIHQFGDFFLTSILWVYFLFGYLVLLPVLYIPAYMITKNHATVLQNINHVHLKCFFALARALIRRTKYDIPEKVREIRSSIIICNHISYLDPILLVSI